MIEVERLTGQVLLVNPDLIQTIEATPDTLVTFTDGHKLFVKTKPEDIVRRIIEFRKKYSIPEVK